MESRKSRVLINAYVGGGKSGDFFFSADLSSPYPLAGPCTDWSPENLKKLKDEHEKISHLLMFETKDYTRLRQPPLKCLVNASDENQLPYFVDLLSNSSIDFVVVTDNPKIMAEAFNLNLNCITKDEAKRVSKEERFRFIANTCFASKESLTTPFSTKKFALLWGQEEIQKIIKRPYIVKPKAAYYLDLYKKSDYQIYFYGAKYLELARKESADELKTDPTLANQFDTWVFSKLVANTLPENKIDIETLGKNKAHKKRLIELINTNVENEIKRLEIWIEILEGRTQLARVFWVKRLGDEPSVLAGSLFDVLKEAFKTAINSNLMPNTLLAVCEYPKEKKGKEKVLELIDSLVTDPNKRILIWNAILEPNESQRVSLAKFFWQKRGDKDNPSLNILAEVRKLQAKDKKALEEKLIVEQKQKSQEADTHLAAPARDDSRVSTLGKFASSSEKKEIKEKDKTSQQHESIELRLLQPERLELANMIANKLTPLEVEEPSPKSRGGR